MIIPFIAFIAWSCFARFLACPMPADAPLCVPLGRVGGEFGQPFAGYCAAVGICPWQAGILPMLCGLIGRSARLQALQRIERLVVMRCYAQGRQLA
jgi:hypothetical protein